MDICIERYEADSNDESAHEEAQNVAPMPAPAVTHQTGLVQ